ncbi:MAG: FAD-dependent oxidoreductase, partial [Clostridia bacterium]
MKTEYVKGKPYFSDNVEKLEQFPYLDKNIECDVLIIGGGINGAICGHYFSQDKIDTVIIDKNVVGYGNTSCATALLEYQMDDFANDLKKYFSKNDIVKAYNIGLKALNDIQKIIDKQGNDCFYSKRDTFLFSSNIFDKNAIEREFDFRINNGFNVQYLTDSNNKFNFNFKYGILAKDGGAEFNPYLFTKQLIKNRNKK